MAQTHELSVTILSIIDAGHDRISLLCDEFMSTVDGCARDRIVHDISQPIAGIKLALHTSCQNVDHHEVAKYNSLLDILVDALNDVAADGRSTASKSGSLGANNASPFLRESSIKGGTLADAANVGLWARRSRADNLEKGVSSATVCLLKHVMYGTLFRANEGRVLMSLRRRMGRVCAEVWAYSERGVCTHNAYEGAVQHFARIANIEVEEVAFAPTLIVRRIVMA